MTHVVAAIIRKDDKILICQRGAGGNCAFLWEFPGGKQESGESLTDCLIRECREELDVEIEIGRLYAEASHKYSERHIAFTFFDARIVSGVPKMNVHTEICWVYARQLAEYEFCPADVDVIAMLTRCEK